MDKSIAQAEHTPTKEPDELKQSQLSFGSLKNSQDEHNRMIFSHFTPLGSVRTPKTPKNTRHYNPAHSKM